MEKAKFELMMKNALDQFKSQGDRVEAMAQEIAYLKGSVDMFKREAAHAGAPKFRGVYVPWETPQVAKDFVTFARAILTKDDATAKSMAEGTDPEGGYLVPEEYKATLLRIVEQYGALRREAQIVPMAREEMRFPTFDTYAAGNWQDGSGDAGSPCYWPDELVAITEAWPQFGDTLLTAKKLAALIPSSGELLQDSVIPIANLIVTLVGEFMAKEEDRVGFVGDTGGTDTFDGALTSAGNTTVLGATEMSVSDVTADHLLDMQTDTPRGAMAGAKYYMHRSVFAHVRKLKASGTGEYIYDAPGANTPGLIWGYPFELIEALPIFTAGDSVSTRYILFGNMKNYYLGDRMTMSMAQTDIVGFAKFQTHFRFLERIAMKAAIPAGLTALVTAAA